MSRAFTSGLAAVLLAAAIIVVTPAGSEAATTELSPTTLGMRPSGGFLDADRLAQYEQELGGQINWYVAMAGRQSPADMTGSVQGQLRKNTAVLPTIADRMNLVMTVPLAFGKQTAKTDAGRRDIRSRLLVTAKGEWDDSFRAVATSLVDGGYPDAVIRLGHEFTGSWYPWSAQGNEDAYIAAYRHVHEVMRSVSADFRFEWNAARNTFVEHGPEAYPGDAYVDVVGLDVYYEPWKGDKEFTDARWQSRYQAVLEAHQEFATSHGKPVSYAEWANGGVDQPEFIRSMHDWFASLPTAGSGSLLYHSYFNVNKALYNLDNYPSSKQAYIELFGGGGATATSENSAPTPIVVNVSDAVRSENPATAETSVSAAPVSNASFAPLATSRQVTLFDQQVTHRADSYATMDFAKMADWSSPVDYTSGKTYARLDITSKPSDREVKVLTCMWRDRFAQETCTNLGRYTESGVHYVELPSVDRWWRKDQWDWDRPIDFVRILVKDVKTGKLLNDRKCGSACFRGNDLADHTPIGFDAHMILVAKGQTLEVPSDWAGCPASWGGICATGGSGTPTTSPTTPPTTTPPATTPTTTPPTTTPTTATLPSTTPTTSPSAPAPSPTAGPPTLVMASHATAVVGSPITIDIDTDASSLRWWKVRSPGGLKWGDRSAEDVQVEFLTPGTYLLAITARGNGQITRGRISVVVTKPSATTTTATTSPAPAPEPTVPPAPTPTTEPAPPTVPTTTGGNGGSSGSGGNDDVMSVRSASATEGSTLVFKLVLDSPASEDIVATVNTFDISAIAGEDYRARQLEVLIPAGSRKAYIGIPTFKDSSSERTETMRLKVTAINGVAVDIAGGTGEIRNR